MRIQYQILGFLLFLHSNNIKIENAVGKSKIPMLLHADRDPRTAMQLWWVYVPYIMHTVTSDLGPPRFGMHTVHDLI